MDRSLPRYRGKTGNNRYESIFDVLSFFKFLGRLIFHRRTGIKKQVDKQEKKFYIIGEQKANIGSEMNYIPLRVHSVFSRGRGAVDPREFSVFLKKLRISAMAVSDSFGMIGWEHFRREALGAELKPLLGVELKIQRLGTFVLFPRTTDGFLSMVCSLNQKKFLPMADVVTIFIPPGGAVLSTAVFSRIRDQVQAENFYMGLEWHTPKWALGLSSGLSVPLVWAQPLKWIGNPARYAVCHSVFSHRSISEISMPASKQRLMMFGPMDRRAIVKRWRRWGEEALANTFRVAGQVAFDFSDLSSRQKPAAGADRLLEKAVNEAALRMNLKTAGRARTASELKVIRKLGFSGYFLIAADIGNYCRKRGIYFNLRGSGVSSFILYLLGLSKVDPLNHNLLFQRFVNRLREDLPDIDIDFDSSRRQEVLEWIFRKYHRKVAFVSTHKFFRARSALYEVARSHGFNPEESHRLSKGLPMFARPAELKGRGRGQLAEIYNHASLLDGVYRELSLHLGGVVFSDDPVERSFPLEKSPGGFPQVIWDKDSVERLKIFKLDILGVRGFDVISPVAVEDSVSFGDPAVWRNIREARTVGCFQLESPLARKNLRMAKPGTHQELAISIAIIRPGPAKSGMKKRYIEREAPIHPVLGRLFPHTRGALIFEEQITLLLHRITGWSLEESEKIRKELKKKRGGVYREDYFARGRKRKWTQEDLEMLWKIAVDFSLYAFNHGHSVSYAHSAYISAWLKTKNPVTFFSRLFNSGGGYYTLPFYIEEAKKWGVPILPPDINRSGIGFSEEGDAIRTGLIFIRNVGEKLSSRIVDRRGYGYANLEDFYGRCGVGERELSSLVAVSALKSIGYAELSEKQKQEGWKKYLGFLPGGGGRVKTGDRKGTLQRAPTF